MPGVLFVDEVHMLDLECFTYLNRALESSMSPIVVFATNRGMCTIRYHLVYFSGSDGMIAPHGVPTDLLDRLLIIRTLPYTISEIQIIVGIRAKTEGIPCTPAAISKLSEIGGASSLRYAIQLLTPAYVLTKINGRTEISVDDVEDVEGLFYDAKSSAKVLHLSKDRYIS